MCLGVLETPTCNGIIKLIRGCVGWPDSRTDSQRDDRQSLEQCPCQHAIDKHQNLRKENRDCNREREGERGGERARGYRKRITEGVRKGVSVSITTCMHTQQQHAKHYKWDNNKKHYQQQDCLYLSLSPCVCVCVYTLVCKDWWNYSHAKQAVSQLCPHSIIREGGRNSKYSKVLWNSILTLRETLPNTSKFSIYKAKASSALSNVI